MSAPRDEVFAAVARMVRLGTLEIGASASMLVLERDARAVWRCEDGPQDWVGTEIAIELTSEGAGTVVRFAHRSWREATEVMASWTTRWGRGLLGVQRLVAIAEPDDVRA